MHPASTEQHRTAAVVAAAARLPKSRRAPDYKRFLETYYGNVDPEDMAARAPADLAGAALAHLKFAHTRRGRALVRVFNPTLREHGYTSPHTVIEVVNDDMPFLVDSIGLALTRSSLTMHFLAHPIFAVSRDTAGALRSIEGRAAVTDKHLRLESSSMPRWIASSIPRSLNRCARISSGACAMCASHAPTGPRCAPRRGGLPMISAP